MTGAPGAGREDIFETDLHGYLDGELPAERRAGVEHYLATHPNHAARFAEFRTLTLSLHRLYGAGPPVNQRIEALTADLDRALNGRRRARRLLRIAVGVLVLGVGAGVVSGLFGAGKPEDRFLDPTRQATGASAETSGAAKDYLLRPAPGTAGVRGDDAAAQPTATPASESAPAGTAGGTPKKT